MTIARPASARVLVVFGTRPEAIKLFPVVHELARTPGLQVRTCVTAQHRGLLDQVLAIAGLVPDIDLDLMEPGQSLDRLTARLLTGLGEVMDAEPAYCSAELDQIRRDVHTVLAAPMRPADAARDKHIDADALRDIHGARHSRASYQPLAQCPR